MGGRLEVRFASFGDHSLVRPCLGRLGLDVCPLISSHLISTHFL